MSDHEHLHLAYQLTPRLAALFDAWDAGMAGEEPLARHRWTDLALRPAARGATVSGSTGIEGNPLGAVEVEAVLAGGSASPRPGVRPADIRDVLNYNRALDLVNRAALRPDFEWSQELLRRINAAVLDGLEDDEGGEYRDGPVSVGGVFEPPEAERLPGLMARLEGWLRADDGTDHTLLRAGLAHLNVVSIHPWRNGNGRTARVVGSLALMRRGIAAPELVNVESWIREHAVEYGTVLQETHGREYRPAEHSATPWLEFYAQVSVDRLELRDRLLAAAGADIGLLVITLDAARESLAWAPILLAAAMGPVRTSALAGLLDLSSSRVRSMLASMVSARWLATVGDRRGRTYVAGPRVNELDLRSPSLMDRLRRGSA